MSRRLFAWLVPAAAAAALLVAAFADPTATAWFPRCPFHAVTGLACPGCGSARALYALLHADLPSALRLNPLFVLLSPVLAIGTVREYRRISTGRDPLDWQLSPALVWTGIAIAATFTLLRNVPGFNTFLGPP